MFALTPADVVPAPHIPAGAAQTELQKHEPVNSSKCEQSHSPHDQKYKTDMFQRQIIHLHPRTRTTNMIVSFFCLD